MENRNILKQIAAPGGIIILAVLSRLIPHIPNVTPIAAIALFGGASMTGYKRFLIPFGAMILSDVFLGFHNTMPFVYGSFCITILLGRYIQKTTMIRITTFSVISSTLFFLITNFGVWAVGSMYSKTFTGLMQAYNMGLPFFRNTLLGDMMYTYLLFYGYSFVNDIFMPKTVALSKKKR